MTYFDAVDGTPVLDVKPWFAVVGPSGAVREPGWKAAMLAGYYAAPGDR